MAKRRILVVEDDPISATMVQRLLRRLGYEVIGPLAGGEDAVRRAKESEPDLVLMDIGLQGEMDGIQAAEEIRSLRDIPVIYLTARSDQSTLERAKGTEPYGYLLKPFSERELYVTVETAAYKAALEIRLKESEQRFRSLFENCPVALLELDLSETKSYIDQLKSSGAEDMREYLDKNRDELTACIAKARIIGANPAALDLFDARDAGEFARAPERFFLQDRQDGIIAYVAAVGRGLPTYRGSATLKTLSGKEISTVWTSSVFAGHEGTFSRVSLCLLDVTERKRAEAALRHSEEKYRAIFDNAAIGIDLVGDDGRFVETNSALCHMLGYHQDELEKLTILDVTHPDDVDTSKAMHEALTQGACSTYRLEKRYLRRDGEIVWTDLSCSAIRDLAGHYQGTVGVIADITDRKRYEKSQAQLVDEIRNFAYIVSHDLRSPLVNLSGFSRELMEAIARIRPAVELGLSHMPEEARLSIQEALEDDIPECFTFIGSSISHMNKQVSGILRLSRLGSSELRFEPLPMNEIAEEILSTFAYEIGKRGLTVSVEPLPDIVADRSSVEQIVANLVGNAIKYLEPDRGGDIRIRGERLLEETRFEVRDNGRGIRAEDLSRIFDIFQRVGRLDVSGEGMGLSYVRTLVRRHGGSVWCESSPGVGSRFFFTIAHPGEMQT